ncbi:hypothetical protein N7448_004245 [Penicillium atrosanguineum]|uniref:Uncharacterized protein n=1 Tax=Penicillium atrosanguineum TaxID=1132637 RepID=A0A9W9H901_9EURO|nr:uncharacterized protein N7443_003210 [Penicillium atrosanguineum]KAJ5118108.1 hypothetical protein N7526_011131 [Penicillium atrosanguineum]KAJ5140837.1 hypothetical protein N7448_004245 [Penicillium atrosanguineum]KAJ5310749.1 hypothetical protein N7443_003210 [Penicillium atrosanguineum]KAJ5316272.1 hypothetical protein N7476_006579 [Penicillium atrosanguineum]
MRVPHLPYLPSSHFGGDDTLLLQFFNESKSQILTPIINDSLAHFIMRVALSDSSFTSNLVLEGILTIASLQLQGVSKSSARQHRLISLLRENIMQIDKENVLRNLITTMLLYQYEVCTTASPKKCWSLYLCGAKKIIDASSATVELYKDESAVLMDWIYYHEVVSEFSIRHWAEADAVDSFCKGPLAIRPKGSSFDGSEISSKNTCPTDVLDLLRVICKRPSTCDHDDLTYDKSDIAQMYELKRRLEEAVGENGTFHDIAEVTSTRQGMLAYLYRCATLIYLNRAVLKVSNASFHHRRLVREGILVLQNLGFCESAWPMLILACEANEDEQRLQILQTLSQSGQEPLHRSSHVPLIQRMIEAIWNQNDLGCDSDVDYSRTLHAVISTAPALPLFA